MSAPDYFWQLQERIKSHRGKPVFDALRVYEVSVNFLAGNSNQLRQIVSVLEDPKNSLQIMSQDRQAHFQGLLGSSKTETI